MKIERREEETDEDWAERLAYEIEIANNTETTQYFVERDPYDESGIIINYIGEDRWTWKEHPEGPFNCKQILEWKRCYDVVVPELEIKLFNAMMELKQLRSSKEKVIE